MSKNSLTELINILQKLDLKCRVRTSFDDAVSEWSTFVTTPTQGYIETSDSGPVSINDLKSIEVDPVRQIIVGRRVPPKKQNLRAEFLELLRKHCISYEEVGEYLRINFQSD